MKSEEPKKSALLESLERIESLVDMAFKMSVRQSVNGIFLSIISESAIAYKLAIHAAFCHVKYTYIDDDNDVDCDYWKDRINILGKKLEIFTDDKSYNKKTLTPRTIISILEKHDENSNLFKNRHMERTTSIEVNMNKFGFDYIERGEEERKCIKDIDKYIKRVNDEIENQAYNSIPASTFNYLHSEEEKRDHFHNQVSVWKGITESAIMAVMRMIYALNILDYARDTRRIPYYMFEDYCQIQINEDSKKLEKEIKSCELKLNQYADYPKECFLRNAIDTKLATLSNEYTPETIASFIDSDYIDNKSKEFKGYTLYGLHPAKIPVIMGNLGRFVYGMFCEQKNEEAKQLLLDICLLAFSMKKLKDIISPAINNMEWPNLAHDIFLDEVKFDGIKYKVNLETIYNLCKVYLENDVNGKSTDCRWLALLLFAKQWGFLKYKHQKNGKDTFEISIFANFLNEWKFNVKASKITPYKYLLMSDEIADFYTQKLSVIDIPKGSNSNVCNKTGVENIQRFLNLLLENCTKHDIFFTSNVN